MEQIVLPWGDNLEDFIPLHVSNYFQFKNFTILMKCNSFFDISTLYMFEIIFNLGITILIK